MVKPLHPGRGSKAYRPRVRAKRPYPTMTRITPEKGIAGFAGYKVGMTRILMIDDRKHSMTAGQEVLRPVTVVEVPPLKVFGFVSYEQTPDGLRMVSRSVSDSLSKDLARKVTFGKKKVKDEDHGDIIRLLAHTQPRLTGLGKKTPEVFEIPIAEYGEEGIAKAKELSGKDLSVQDVFQAGQFVDVISVSKGRGREGPVQRYGVKLLSHKAEKTRRKAGIMNAWHPAHASFYSLHSGQMGFHRRTEYNKKIYFIGEDVQEVNPDSGFLRYGTVKSTYLLIHGSLPGSRKRLVFLRQAIRVRDGGRGQAPTVSLVVRQSR